MQIQTLTRAISIGITALLATGNTAAAMHMRPSGVGQVLIYPYYTVAGGNQTVFHVVNTTDLGKAIKLRFREGRNAREVLSFNLYLAPFDVWTANLFDSTSPSGRVASLSTMDESCTAPAIKHNNFLPALANGVRYKPFVNFIYTGVNDDSGANALTRTREGYFELIEMGVVDNVQFSSLDAIEHAPNGIPANCQQVQSAWTSGSSNPYWLNSPNADLFPPSGGLFGAASIINALEGTMLSYPADAIAGFSDVVQHTGPGSALPTLASARSSATEATAQVFSGDILITSTYPLSRAIDAVSALFMQERTFNQFATDSTSGAESEWVLTLPTKFAYTDPAIIGATAIAPFTHTFGTEAGGSAPVDMTLGFFNQAQGQPDSICDPRVSTDCIPSPSPLPPSILVDRRLFWSTNVITFNQPKATSSGSSSILGSQLVRNIELDINPDVLDGWGSLGFFAAPGGVAPGSLIQQHRLRTDQQGGSWAGLPVTGFWAVHYTKLAYGRGLSRYSDATPHRGENLYQPPPQ